MPYRRQNRGPGINYSDSHVSDLNEQLSRKHKELGGPLLVIYKRIPVEKSSVARHVYQGKYENEECFVAVKEYNKNDFFEVSAEKEQKLREIEGEIKHLGKLRHPWIITSRGKIEPNDDAWLIVLEWFGEMGLYDRLKSLDSSNPHLYLSVMDKVVSAVQYAHENRIIHRDIKPDNIFVSESLDVRLMDFGMACAVDNTASRTSGSERYRSPSHHKGSKLSEYADIFPLGLIIYEVFTGQFKEKSLSGELARLRTQAEEKLKYGGAKKSWPELERECVVAVQQRVKPEDFLTAGSALSAIVRKAIDPDPGLCYKSAATLRLDLHLAFRAPEVSRLEDLLKTELQPAMLQQIFYNYQSFFPAELNALPALHDSVVLKGANDLFKQRQLELTKKLLAYYVRQAENPYQPNKAQLKSALLQELNGSITYDEIAALSRSPDPSPDLAITWIPAIRTCGKLWDIFENAKH